MDNTAAPPAAPAPAAAAPSAPAPSAPAPVATPAPAAAPAAPATPEGAAPVVPQPAGQPVVPAAPVKFDPKTSVTPPSSADYPDTQQGIADFIRENTEWSMAHPEEAEKIRTAKLAAEDNGELADTTQQEAKVAAEVAKVDGEQEKPAEAKPEAVTAATPALVEGWKAEAPELAAAFEKYPEKYQQIMETARAAEAAKPVLDIVSTPEEATFAVEHANRLVSLQTNWMLSGEDPEMIGPAWDQTVDMFKERDADGKEVLGTDGKPKLGADFKPFRNKAAATAMEDYSQAAQAQIAAIEARLAGVYPSDEAKEADAALLENMKYERLAFDFVLGKLGQKDDGPALPALSPNATPEQVAFQKQLDARQKELDAKQGKQTTESRKAARATLDREVQNFYEAGVTGTINTHVAAMKERGEYLPDFVLNDKYINPSSGKVTNLPAFNVKIYLALNDKINSNPLHAAKLGSLQAMGAAGKASREAEITRLQNLYLPKLIDAEVKRIQDGIRASSGRPKDNTGGGIARVEPQSGGGVQPAPMDSNAVRQWAEAEAAKDPSFEGMDSRQREELVIRLGARKRFGG